MKLSTGRILVTGSRTWGDAKVIHDALSEVYFASKAQERITVVHGACPRGADRIAADWVIAIRAAEWIVDEEPHPADWDRLGKRAGFVRNAEMVNLGADVCLAFIRDGSRGATHTADLAEKAGIPVRRWTA